MKGYVIALLGVAAIVLFSSASANANTSINLDNIDDPDAKQRLQRLINALAANGLSDETIKFCLAQILQETGMLNSSANYTAMDGRNNYAGINNRNGGGYAVYDNIADFVTDYIRVLSLPSHYPIEATSIQDFNNRLKANGYYTDSATTYGNNLNYYYNLLS